MELKITEEIIAQLDTENMRGLMIDYPKHWEEISKKTEGVQLNIDTSKIQNICFAGMGGSAIGADIIRAYTQSESPYPIQVVRHYEIPKWVGEHTLFIACSYSGNTEETISALDKALESGAQIVGVTSGGKLAELAETYKFDTIEIPGGLPPRAALAYSFVPLFRIFQSIGMLSEGEEALAETLQLLKDRVEEYNTLDDNLAFDIAKSLYDKLPIIYSDSQLLETVNLRWRGQLEENSKILTYGNMLPEMNHNEIIGWEKIDHLKGKLAVIFLTDKEDHKRVRFREEVLKTIIVDKAATVIEIETTGTSKLARIFSLVQLADWVSLFLAFLNRVNPTRIEYIDTMKAKLAEFN